MSQDELQKALRVARSVHDRETGPADGTAVILGALLRAVELLAERQDKPVADKRIEELEHEQRECLSLITESNLCMPGRTLVEAVKDLIELHGTAKNKIAELEKDKRRAEARVRAWEARTGETGPSAPRIVGAKLEPVTVDGKTPGEVALEAWNPDANGFTIYSGDWERAAQAVLRTFGQPSQTTQSAVEALERVHSAIKHNLSLLPYNTSYMGGVAVVRKDDVEKSVQRPFDDALTKLKAKPTESGVPDAVLREMP